MSLRAVALAALPFVFALPVQAQSFEGPVTGTLDCPARSLFDSGSTPVRGQVRNGEMTVTLPEMVVSGRILNLGSAAVRLEGETRQMTAAFTGVVLAGGQLHARGVVGDRPCNLNLALSTGAAQQPRPQPQPQSQSSGAGGSLEGAWAGTVNCPTRDLSDSGEIQARGTVVNNVLSLAFEDVRVAGRILGVSPTPLMRLDGQGPRSGAASFDALVVTPQRIHARGLVGQQPCNVTLTPARPASAPIQAAPRPPVAQPQVQQAARPPVDGGVGKPGGPMSQQGLGGGDEKPPPLGAAPALPAPVLPTPVLPAPPPEPQRPPPVASAPRPVLPGAAPAPTPAPVARPPGPAAADQLACALAGTCPPPQR
ncbi:hypothetical protein [Falsiroseomonas stagni]|uniref:Uncharacterized protein n=1 Tax=Falsiroseomonas stagni DSM 19981 TaxID=1123062 RepID=A0A1I4EEY9_9PROT|nr:hypothetical protein [Falsiroseomonas stagni]SFL03823.1 hypothetical protein SAMN02745775_115106 [Falsiroseomonas stagni DSM 19981]